jgi:hypothetical protein
MPVARSGRPRLLVGAGVIVAAAAVVAMGPAASSGGAASPWSTAVGADRLNHAPPRRAGYFKTTSAGTWRKLPGGANCTSRVHRSTWEPRPDNSGPNSRMPNVKKVHAAFADRRRSGGGSFKPRWDTWLLPRVTGHYTGTTDEIFQWAACKWGIADNLLRAIAVRESTWYQYEIYPPGRCVTDWGCGDMVGSATPATRTFCSKISRRGHDYQADYGVGICPETFSIAGVMSWQDPDWGKMKGNQNGTFPFNRNSTAFAVDYLGANLRGCYEGWEPWLSDAGPVAYQAGDIWGCVGSWYAGEWRTQRALGYIHRVRRELRHRTWLESDWKSIGPSCSSTYGCPIGS